MTKDETLSVLRARADLMRRMGAVGLYLYGSTARGDASADSDVDLFIDYDGSQKFSLLDLFGIKLLLEDVLDAQVDLTTRNSLHPMLKADIESSAIRVF